MASGRGEKDEDDAADRSLARCLVGAAAECPRDGLVLAAACVRGLGEARDRRRRARSYFCSSGLVAVRRKCGRRRRRVSARGGQGGARITWGGETGGTHLLLEWRRRGVCGFWRPDRERQNARTIHTSFPAVSAPHNTAPSVRVRHKRDFLLEKEKKSTGQDQTSGVHHTEWSGVLVNSDPFQKLHTYDPPSVLLGCKCNDRSIHVAGTATLFYF